MIQHQHWEDSIRILVTDEQHHGSIQVFIPHRTEDKPLDGAADALIYSLWVDEAHRGHEVVKTLDGGSRKGTEALRHSERRNIVGRTRLSPMGVALVRTFGLRRKGVRPSMQHAA